MQELPLNKLCCPLCREGLHQKPLTGLSGSARNFSTVLLECANGHTYTQTNGIWDFLRSEFLETDSAKRLESESHDEHAQSHWQAETIDEQHLFSWIDYYQLFEILPRLRHLRPRSILVGMCGSGLEFEILRRITPDIWGLDISRGVLQNAKIRANRLGLQGEIVRGDAENLPFTDNAFDLVMIHHGLHHLPKLEVALKELLRVSSRHVLLFEPIAGWPRRLARRIGVSAAVEPGGTIVHDINAKDVVNITHDVGAAISYKQGYCYMRTRLPSPTWLFHLADRLKLAQLMRWPMRVFNSMFGNLIGFKVTFLLTKKEI